MSQANWISGKPYQGSGSNQSQAYWIGGRPFGFLATSGNIKSLNGVAFASIKKWSGIAIASVKTINGITSN
jgi:hypothetical protein